MADKREEQEEPKIRIVDRRMLNDDERAGKGAAADAPISGSSTEQQETSTPPKLEIIGGGQRQPVAPDEEPEEGEETEELELSEEEAAEMREQMEAEQFAAIEQQMGRPLTEQEKGAVREEMERRAQSIANLDVAPVLLELLTAMPRYAFVHLGLMPNPYTQLIAKNDSQARLAIDAFAAIYNVVKPSLDPRSRTELERVLNDLRTNFVSVTGTPVGEPTGPRIIH